MVEKDMSGSESVSTCHSSAVAAMLARYVTIRLPHPGSERYCETELNGTPAKREVQSRKGSISRTVEGGLEPYLFAGVPFARFDSRALFLRP